MKRFVVRYKVKPGRALRPRKAYLVSCRSVSRIMRPWTSPRRVPLHLYSARIATSGSTRIARLAGTRHATAATARMTAPARPNDTPSYGATP